jgi:predicted CoA-binding protein
MIDDFLSNKNLALVRTAPAAKVHGFRIDQELGKRGYTVSVVYLEGGDKTLASVGHSLDGVIVAAAPDRALDAVKQVAEAGVKQVWMQEGSESAEAIEFCEENGIAAIHGECVMMFAEPVKGVHAFHRWLWKIFKRLPA